MNSEMIRDLIFNASLLLVISIIYNTFFVKYEKHKKLNNVIAGIIIGFVGVLLIMNTVRLDSGVILDTRSILVSVSAMFFGLVPAIIATAIIVVYRVMLAGNGALVGVVVTIFSAGIGLIWHYFRLNYIMRKKTNPWLEFYLMGLVTHIIMLMCFFTLPKDFMMAVIYQIFIPVILIYPIGSVVLCMVVFTSFKNIQTRLDLKESEERFRTIFEQSPIGIGIGKNGRIYDANRKFAEISRLTKDELLNTNWEIFTHPDDIKEQLDLLGLLDSGKINSFNIDKRYICHDGTLVWVNLTVTMIKITDSSHSVQQMDLFMVEDITEQKKATEMLKQSEANYKRLYHKFQNKQNLLMSLIDSIPDLIFYKDCNLIYVGSNKAFEKFAGMEENQIIGHSDFEIFDKKMAERFRMIDLEILKGNIASKNEEMVTYPDGSEVFLETLKTPYYDSQGNTLGIIGISRDITERKKKEEEILYLNYHDTLTGLYNRTFFDEEKKRIDTRLYLPLSIIMSDINGLKLLNDALGHEEGDKLLIEMANILKKCIKPTDIVARTGGDEFCILLPKTNNNDVQLIVDLIKKTCEEYVNKTDKEVYYASIALGFGTKAKEEESFDKVFKSAEEYMYMQKLLEYKSLHSSIISSIKTTMFEKSNETEAHAERLAALSKKLGQVLGLTKEKLVELELLSTLHDIGKISVDLNILAKGEALTEEEWLKMKKHPEVGYRITQASPELRHISEYILCHHERWDGKGYPQGLAGEVIPLLSRILAVVDAFDAMTEDRPYRKAMTADAAILEIKENAGSQFDPEIAMIFIEMLLAESLA